MTDEPHLQTGDDVIVVPWGDREPTDEELTIEFVNKYREKMGLPPIKNFTKAGLKGSLGQGLSLYRYLAPGRQFAITSDEKVKDALVEAGAHRVIPFTKSPDVTATVHYDISLPTYLWAYL